MITLFINRISEKHKGYKPYKNIVRDISQGNFPISVSGPKGFYLSILLAQVHLMRKKGTIIVVPTEKEAKDLISDLQEITQGVLYFPDWGVIPYSGNEPQAHTYGKRLECLMELLHGDSPVIIATVRSLITTLPQRQFLEKNSVSLRKNTKINPQQIEDKLVLFGYLKVPKVSVPGEFALRGEVLDIFLYTFEEPVRIVFEWEEIENIKFFDPYTQTSTGILDEIVIHPVREVLWTEERVNAVQKRVSSLPGTDVLKPALEDLREKRSSVFDEYLFPLSFPEPADITDFAPEGTLYCFIDYERCETAFETIVKEFEKLAITGKNRFPVPREYCIHDFLRIREGCSKRIDFYSLLQQGEVDHHLPCEPGRSFFGNISYLKEEINNLHSNGYEVFIFTESDSQQTRISQLLKELPAEIMKGNISEGFTLPECRIMAVQENEIFGRRKRIPPSVKKARTATIETFVDLNPGDFIVHINYGIGKFESIDRIQAANTVRDYIKLLYADEERIFIPIEQVNLIQKYIGSEGNTPRLDKIGGKAWEKRKIHVKKSVEDLASRLIKLYSKRRDAAGHAFQEDNEWQLAFEAGFPYEETEDQLSCIEEVKQDMETVKPMDRLICGDVGYGKTEIGMRAAFKAVMGGKQVAFLAPTTILTEQHYENFVDRFSKFPVNVAMISRFVGKGEQREILKKVHQGDIDILIGTHRLLQKDVHFKNIGLLIIDEEQRFGVKDKERLKELKHSVDCLTLSATPIPRTLHMSLLKIRDMSVLNTPPSNRRPIETRIGEFNEETITEAVRKEISRNGQVFFLHNRIETLEDVKGFLEKIVPEALIDIAHGQMNSRKLEDIMHRFVHGAFQVLVSTTIIENGIDIPNVNTIIIDRADLFGISQLYQLRGRVGRSDRTAYAYLLYPGERILSEIAMKRLRIISDNTELGSGFKVALKDMEVRGAGNLLGREQHGDILSVGFDMYLKLLDEAVSEMTEEEREEAPEVYLELEYSGFIPDSYIREPEEKMEVYKNIASISDEEELSRVAAMLEDRFGPMPDEIQSLLSLAEIRIICKKLWISSLQERKGTAKITFSKVSIVPVDRILRLIKEGGGNIKLDPHHPNMLTMKTNQISLKAKSEFIREKLSYLI